MEQLRYTLISVCVAAWNVQDIIDRQPVHHRQVSGAQCCPRCTLTSTKTRRRGGLQDRAVAGEVTASTMHVELLQSRKAPGAAWAACVAGPDS
jgi:hypothetical protein